MKAFVFVAFMSALSTVGCGDINGTENCVALAPACGEEEEECTQEEQTEDYCFEQKSGSGECETSIYCKSALVGDQ